MDGKFVIIHLGAHRIQMHVRADAGDIQGQDGLHLTCTVLKQVLGQKFNCLRRGPLGDSHGQDPIAQVQDISSLNGKRILPLIIKWRPPPVIRMMLQDVLTVNGFPSPCP